MGLLGRACNVLDTCAMGARISKRQCLGTHYDYAVGSIKTKAANSRSGLSLHRWSGLFRGRQLCSEVQWITFYFVLNLSRYKVPSGAVISQTF